MARRAAAQLTVSALGAAPASLAGASAPAGRLGAQAALARALATDAVSVAHPPQQSMRTGFKDTDASHTSKWMQARSSRDRLRIQFF